MTSGEAEPDSHMGSSSERGGGGDIGTMADGITGRTLTI